MVRMSLILAEDVVRYARWLSELINGRVEVQSRARRSYRAVVMPTDALLTFGILKLTSLILTEYRGWSRRLFYSLGWYGAWDKEEWMEVTEMRGSGAMRENEHELATCYKLCMLLSDASCSLEVEAQSSAEVQTELAAAMSTKRILINKQRKRQYRSGRVHALLR